LPVCVLSVERDNQAWWHTPAFRRQNQEVHKFTIQPGLYRVAQAREREKEKREGERPKRERKGGRW
jgi:hypothetical protein